MFLKNNSILRYNTFLNLEKCKAGYSRLGNSKVICILFLLSLSLLIINTNSMESFGVNNNDLECNVIAQSDVREDYIICLLQHYFKNNMYKLVAFDTVYNSTEKLSTLDKQLCQGNAKCFIGNITKIIDGDTLDVNNIRVRLSLIDSPELQQTGYIKAKKLTQSLCKVGSLALVDEDDRQTAGSHGRLIGLVYCGDEKSLLNKLLLDTGNAKVLKKLCTKSEFANSDWAKLHGCNFLK